MKVEKRSYEDRSTPNGQKKLINCDSEKNLRDCQSDNISGFSIYFTISGQMFLS